jgi:hypothetical protein
VNVSASGKTENVKMSAVGKTAKGIFKGKQVNQFSLSEP